MIIEPIVGNMGLLPPEPGFLEDVARLCRERDILLIFDEVITGFRVGYGGAQGLYGITPDLTCLGKIIGGGFPIGAYGGKREIMERIAPLGDVYQAGTLSGNPVAVRAGLYVLNYLRERKEVYEGLKRRGDMLCDGVADLAREFGIPYRINRVTGMFTGFFADHKVFDYESAMASNRNTYEAFFKGMCSAGVFFAPSPFETAFITLSHGDREIQFTLKAFREVFRSLADGVG
jgi:glutamate-1-semialdehyde 2,1-aminomutase